MPEASTPPPVVTVEIPALERAERRRRWAAWAAVGIVFGPWILLALLALVA